MARAQASHCSSLSHIVSHCQQGRRCSLLPALSRCGEAEWTAELTMCHITLQHSTSSCNGRLLFVFAPVLSHPSNTYNTYN